MASAAQQAAESEFSKSVAEFATAFALPTVVANWEQCLKSTIPERLALVEKIEEELAVAFVSQRSSPSLSYPNHIRSFVIVVRAWTSTPRWPLGLLRRLLASPALAECISARRYDVVSGFLQGLDAGLAESLQFGAEESREATAEFSQAHLLPTLKALLFTPLKSNSSSSVPLEVWKASGAVIGRVLAHPPAEAIVVHSYVFELRQGLQALGGWASVVADPRRANLHGLLLLSADFLSAITQHWKAENLGAVWADLAQVGLAALLVPHFTSPTEQTPWKLAIVKLLTDWRNARGTEGEFSVAVARGLSALASTLSRSSSTPKDSMEFIIGFANALQTAAEALGVAQGALLPWDTFHILISHLISTQVPFDKPTAEAIVALAGAIPVDILMKNALSLVTEVEASVSGAERTGEESAVAAAAVRLAVLRCLFEATKSFPVPPPPEIEEMSTETSSRAKISEFWPSGAKAAQVEPSPASEGFAEDAPGVENTCQAIFKSLVKILTVGKAYFHLTEDATFQPEVHKRNLASLKKMVGVYALGLEALTAFVSFVGPRGQVRRILISNDDICDCLIAGALQCEPHSPWASAVDLPRAQTRVLALFSTCLRYYPRPSPTTTASSSTPALSEPWEAVGAFLGQWAGAVAARLGRWEAAEALQTEAQFVMCWMEGITIKHAQVCDVAAVGRRLAGALSLAFTATKVSTAQTILTLLNRLSDTTTPLDQRLVELEGFLSAQPDLAKALIGSLHFRQKEVAVPVLQGLVATVLVDFGPLIAHRAAAAPTTPKPATSLGFLASGKAIGELMEAVEYELGYVDNPTLLQAYLAILPDLFSRLGFELTKHLKGRSISAVLPKLCVLLDLPFDPVVIGALKLIDVVLSVCPPNSLRHHASTVFGAAVFVYIEHLDDEDRKSVEQIEAGVLALLRRLHSALPTPLFQDLVSTVKDEPELSGVVSFAQKLSLPVQ